jgi:hypothetical protein
MRANDLSQNLAAKLEKCRIPGHFWPAFIDQHAKSELDTFQSCSARKNSERKAQNPTPEIARYVTLSTGMGFQPVCGP